MMTMMANAAGPIMIIYFIGDAPTKNWICGHQRMVFFYYKLGEGPVQRQSQVDDPRVNWTEFDDVTVYSDWRGCRYLYFKAYPAEGI